MTAAGTPSWYDVLGVDPGASPEEIRSAWRAGVADLDPTDRRFRVLNQAAEVLLDPERRADHDATLAREAAASGEESADPGPEAAQAGPTAAPGVEMSLAKAGAPSSKESVETADDRRRPVPAWLLVLVALLAAAAVAACVWTWRIEPDQAVEDAAREARAAADRAVVPILSYDWETLDEDQKTAHSFMTSSYREEDYDPLFEVIRQNAPNTRTRLTAEVVASGLVRTDHDAERVDVFLFVDQSRRNAGEKEPVVFKNWVTVTMQRVDGEWLVDGMDTGTTGG